MSINKKNPVAHFTFFMFTNLIKKKVAFSRNHATPSKPIQLPRKILKMSPIFKLFNNLKTKRN